MRAYHGTYFVSGAKVIESDDLKIITSMLEKDLTRMASDPDTWETLYFCNRDNSYWLLSYEHPEMQGGGVKVLNEIREEDAIALSKKLKQ